MLLIYTQKVTPRIVYTFKHICSNILGISVKFSTKIEEFIAHDGMKMSYGKQPLGNELFVQKVDLLMEQGFSEVEIKVQPWGNSFCFFPLPETSALPFDIFAASFYLLSRYEEYLPHVKDEAGRFPAAESLAYQEGFLQSPVVDVWAYKFKEVLEERFPEIEVGKRSFSSRAVIAVEHVFGYRNKGFIRSFLGMHIDMFHLHFGKVFDRIRVLFRLKKDPFNVFEDLIEIIKSYNLKMLFMFQLSDFTVHDRNINHNRMPYRSVIKYVADYAKVGLLLGYYALDDFRILRREKLRMEDIIHSPLEYVMNTKYDLNLPDCYNNLNELEINHDYSMGYPHTPGFRAGTCTPFLFYDINMEVTTPLMVHPYAFNSAAADILSLEDVQRLLGNMMQEVKGLGGHFNAVFKNQDFSEYFDKELNYSFLKQIYEIE
ncbi:polysaccharide deacetylase family protein [Salegentibacter chungangensis]|uniref:Polysaccharide deacetylase family protein n=1 Tax=Salegentibacter chungangensis TaxID=1335724 RepID=A0ABW3NWQ1_9FLAO